MDKQCSFRLCSFPFEAGSLGAELMTSSIESCIANTREAGNTPHNPIRFADTVGIVIELARPEGSVDRLRWYCENQECGKIVFEDAFVCTALGTQIKSAVQEYAGSENKRRCKHCGNINGVAGPALEF